MSLLLGRPDEACESVSLTEEKMDIVDAQVHLNRFGIEGGIAAMNALGISAVLVDEYDGTEGERFRPYDLLPGDIPRPIWPMAKAASLRYPDRLAYLMRVDYREPDLDTILQVERHSIGARALRVCALFPSEYEPFAKGAFRPVFEAAAVHNIPLFVNTMQIENIDPYIEEFCNSPIVLDHCGVATTHEKFEHTLRLARYPNLSLKWAHAPFVFNERTYPFSDMNAKLRQVVDAFGAERVMWASDASEINTGHSWAEMLFYIKDNPVLSPDEKKWILGRTARKVLRWPAP